MGSQHDEKPRQTENGELDAESMLQQIQESDYYRKLQVVEMFVAGKIVMGSISGNAGFILILSDDLWAAAYRKKDEITSGYGIGIPCEDAMQQIMSDVYGDASEPVPNNIPYAHEQKSMPSVCQCVLHSVKRTSKYWTILWVIILGQTMSIDGGAT